MSNLWLILVPVVLIAALIIFFRLVKPARHRPGKP